MQLSIKFKRPTLQEMGISLIIISLVYFVLGSPTFAYSGPNPREAEARYTLIIMRHLMICIPMFVLGVMWTIRGRKSNGPKSKGKTLNVSMNLRSEGK